MSELQRRDVLDPTTFPTKLPTDSTSEIAAALVKAGLSAIPVPGAPAGELFGLIMDPIISRRRNEWWEELARGVVGLHWRLNQLGDELPLEQLVNRLAHDEAFITTTLHATQAALRTHQRETVRALRNAVLNVAVGNAPDEDLRLMYLDVIDGLTPCHMQILSFLMEPSKFGFTDKDENNAHAFPTSKAGEFVARHVSCLRDRPQVYEKYAKGLVARDLIDAPGAFFDGKPTVDNLKSITVTWFGKGFLAFIASPISDLDAQDEPTDQAPDT